MNARGIIRTVPGLGPLTRSPAAQKGIRAARRAAVLRSSSAFAAHELWGTRGGVVAHDLAGGGTAVVRHRTRDVDIFDEILVAPRAYALPREARQRLAKIASPRVLDLGGNIGLFALDLLQHYPSAQVTSVEADPENVPILQACVALNTHADWTVIPAAASNAAGTLMFESGRFADSAVSEDGTVSVPSIDVFDLLADADMVKIDIEGCEWPIIVDERFAQIPAAVVVMEWHAQRCPPERDPSTLAEALLKRAGYETRGSGGVTYGTLWGWK